MRTFAVVAAALLLAGCATDVTTGGERLNSPSEQASPGPQTPEPEPEAEPESEPEPTSTAATCEELMFQRAQGTIRSQQDAFGNDDFQAAWGFASPSFRASVTVDAFQGIIEGTYPFLLDNPDIDFVECQRQGETAFLQVEVSGSPTVVMVYRVVLTNDVWFIDAASIAGSREDVTT